MERERLNTSKVWLHFTKKDQGVAICNLCQRTYSYRSSVSNLGKHLRRAHHLPEAVTDQSNSDNSDEEQEKSSKSKSGPTWTYFEVLDSEKFIANCKICEKQINYESVTDLVLHVKEHGIVPQDSDDEVPEPTPKISSRSSSVWQCFNRLTDKLAVCLICKKILSYKSSISNLRKHCYRKHRGVLNPPSNDDDIKRVIISANGKLYEVDTTKNEVDDDDDDDAKDPMDDPVFIDTQHLEDTEDTQQHSFIEQYKINPKKSTPLPTKRKFKTKFKKQNDSYDKASSSEDEIPFKKRKSAKSIDRLELFGQYVVSLLRELPKNASDQLQCDIVKQIISTKVNIEAQQTSQQTPKYAITIRDIRNSDLSESVTIANDNSDLQVAENVMVESTENDITEK